MKVRAILIFLVISGSVSAQKQNIDWLSFEELEKALDTQPKKVLVHFYADWCVYCKKMDKAVFTNESVQQELQSRYYAVKFNAESQDTIRFGGKTFINANIGKKRTAFHQIPEFLAGRPDTPIDLPATVILDESFSIEQRFYRYIPPKEMQSILKD